MRVHTPYSSYEEFNFTIRWEAQAIVTTVSWCGMKEMGKVLISSGRHGKPAVILRALMQGFHADTRRIICLQTRRIYEDGGVDLSFKIIMGEIDMPVGEIYSSVEGANGELGFI